MKKTILIIAALALILSLHSYAQQALDDGGMTAGRFQITGAKMDIIHADGHGLTTRYGLFKLDTHTGEVWAYIAAERKNGPGFVGMWTPLDTSLDRPTP